jgi:glycosyltransferase involved in cell wall biosynthesis
MEPPTYSICITHYNNVATVKRSLDSILSQIDGRFEVVVVDNFSSDGSTAILEEYARTGKITTLVEKHCSRGLGWQTAVETAKGKYAIVDLDMDDTFKPELETLLRFYHTSCEGFVLAAVADLQSPWSKNVTIGPRSVILELGGWPDVQLYEHSNLWGKAARRDLYRWTSFSLLSTEGGHPERETMFGRLKFNYLRYRELLRQGRGAFTPGEKRGSGQWFAYILARISTPFYPSYKGTTFREFRPRDKRYFIEFEAGTAAPT